MKHLGDGIKQFPKSLQTLYLDLGYNFIGYNEYDMKYLGDGIK